jgi:hypothetical protein
MKASIQLNPKKDFLINKAVRGRINNLIKETKKSGVELIAAFKKMAGINVGKKIADDFESLTEKINKDTRNIQAEIDALGQDTLDAQYFQLERELKELEGKHGQPATKAREELQKNLETLRELRGAKDAFALGKDLSDAIFSGLADGFARGESLAKTWASIVSRVWQNEMSKAIDFLSNQIGIVFKDIFKGLGGQGAFAGVASGLIAIAGMIWQSVESGKTSTVDDFSKAVNTSEAVRGIVAGPTNVAIATISDSMKEALRTTEILLERIAVAVEGGGFGAGGYSSAPGEAITLTAPTQM